MKKKEKNSVGSIEKFCATEGCELVQRWESVFPFWMSLTKINDCNYYILKQ